MAAQEVRRASKPSHNGGMSRGRGKRSMSRIQGGWAPEVQVPGRGQTRGRGGGVMPKRGRGYPPLMQGNFRPGPAHQSLEPPSNDPQPYPPGLNPNAPVFEPKSGGGSHHHQQTSDQGNPGQNASQCYIGQPQDLRHQRYEYIPPEEEVSISQAKKPRRIEVDGEHTISEGPSGLSHIVLFKNFLSKEEADEALCQLDEEIDFKQQINKNRAGQDYLEPRLVRWYGEHPYAYSKVRMEANEEWPPTLLQLKMKIEHEMSMTFNSVLCNKYRSGKDGVAWHSDDEYGLREQPKIASLSLGQTRMFQMRKKPAKGCNPYDYDYSESEKLEIPLTHGTLLLMTGYTQDDWQHQIPKEYHEREMRINLTFRTIYPDERHTRATPCLKGNKKTQNQTKAAR
ncbi:alpha-ketoglutarate-dependent dioxygenase alkB homolog 3-like isoform X2 [Acanthaster planci]|uniref:Alpha-ketoglutarate-dependent dioxygenase alkB homolog 3-like isoform X2 n=1 Tax=Acanthaster planci TaxID=133434 RepID=A0A8B8A060_ACAPL|nr:alpha-ketoglutarate-dependent dioxygenase alkB homolog 3-like isoform X2 [Acanthaster planci]